MIEVLLLLVVVGIVLAVIPIDGTIRNIVVAIIAILVLIWIVNGLGSGGFGSYGHGGFGRGWR